MRDLTTTGMISVYWWKSPISDTATVESYNSGISIQEIVNTICLEIPWGPESMVVSVQRNGRRENVPFHAWKRVRPLPGSVVRVTPDAAGPVAAPLLQLAFAAGSQWIGTAVLGLSGIGLNLFVAGATLIGALLSQALIPPPEQEKQEKDKFFLGGATNRLLQNEPLQRLFGRHRIFPDRSAVGYTEIRGEHQYLRARFCFGYGPLALEQVRFGNTAIHEFENVQIQFRNIDKAKTLALHPQLAGMNIQWLNDSDRMTYYSRNIAEVSENTLLEEDRPVERETFSSTIEFTVTVGFNGLFDYKPNGRDTRGQQANFRVRWRKFSGGSWVGTDTFRVFAETKKPIRFTHTIRNLVADRYVVEVTRTDDDSNAVDESYLVGLTSVRQGGLPSPSGIAEMAVVVRASEQLNGQLDQVNAVGHAILPTLTADGWSQPVTTRNAADAFAAVLRGSTGNEVTPDDELDLEEILSWRSEGWTYDAVKRDGAIGEWLQEICAAGRRRRMISGFEHQPMPDRANDHVRGYYTPHNTRNFTIEAVEWKEIHGLRGSVIAEDRDWAEYQFIVYAPGYSANNATEIEDVQLPGKVLTKGQTTLGQPYQLLTYMLAQALLRSETYTFEAGIDHLAQQVGDKIRVTHDVPQFGVSSGRVVKVEESSGFATKIYLDEFEDAGQSGQVVERIDAEIGVDELSSFKGSGSGIVEIDSPAGWKLRMVIRLSDGTSVAEFEVLKSDGLSNEWEVLDGDIEASQIERGCLALVEALSEEPVELIIRERDALEDLGAIIRCVSAAPGVLVSDASKIPAYDPNITPLRENERIPGKPYVMEIVSNESTMLINRDGTVEPRVAVRAGYRAGSGLAPAYKSVRWRLPDAEWFSSPWVSIDAGSMLTGTLIEEREYDVAVVVMTRDGIISSPSDSVRIVARGLSSPPPVPQNLSISLGETSATLNWDSQDKELDIKQALVRYSPSLTADWNSAQPDSVVAWPLNRVNVSPRSGSFLVRNEDHGGRLSDEVAVVRIDPAIVRRTNVVADEDYSALGFIGTHIGTEVVGGNLRLQLDGSGQFLSEGSFEPATTIDLPAEFSCDVLVDLLAVSRSLDAVAIKDWVSLNSIETLSGADPDAYSISAEFQFYKDGVWSDWLPVSGGKVLGSKFKFRLVLRSLDGRTTAEVTDFRAIVDMPDRIDSGSSIAPSSGERITYTAPFLGGESEDGEPVVQITGVNAAYNSSYELTNSDNTGFSVQWRNSAGTPIEQKYYWLAKGYGRQTS